MEVNIVISSSMLNGGRSTILHGVGFAKGGEVQEFYFMWRVAKI